LSSLLPVYKKWEITPVKAKGSWLTAEDGKDYLDFTSGIGVVNLGHGHEDVMEEVQEQLGKFWHTSNLFQLSIQEEVASQLARLSGLDKVFFCNSGAEANEAALKLARRATGKTAIISCRQSFHGRTFGAMAATGQSAIHNGFGPVLEGFSYLPFNDLNAFEKEMNESTAAVLVEVIQGEGGVIPGTEAFLSGLSKLCQKYDALLIIDEVQTGNGRTGYPFAYLKYEQVKPDIVTTAKGLGNGLPIGAVMARAGLEQAFAQGVHGSTFGGNPISLAASKAVIAKMADDSFLSGVREKSAWFMEELKKLAERTAVIKDVRGDGFMIGLEMQGDSARYIMSLQEKGLLVLTAGPNVVRLLPPLTVTKEELSIALEKIEEVCEIESFTS
jgi:acetylornithine/N-succinyldiaminopimelate aminotransferase